MTINYFTGDYYFLSNFYPADITYNGLTYKNAEAAFQAQKCLEMSTSFTDLQPAQAKRLGRRVKLRQDWESVKLGIMYDIVYVKFTANADLKDKLMATGNAVLIEGNDWGDTYWGVANGFGRNMLGKTLMRIRDELRR